MISGPFFIRNMVGVGCRMMVIGLRLGTLLGTLQRTPWCAFRAHVVADVEDAHPVFLKTIIPSRKATKQYLGEESDDHED
jgi:hypothetical protein